MKHENITRFELTGQELVHMSIPNENYGDITAEVEGIGLVQFTLSDDAKHTVRKGSDVFSGPGAESEEESDQ